LYPKLGGNLLILPPRIPVDLALPPYEFPPTTLYLVVSGVV